MIQRIQSLFLLVATLFLVIAAFVLPVWVETGGVEVFASANTILKGIIIFAALLSLISVFRYSNRKQQLLFSYVTVVSELAAIVCVFLFKTEVFELYGYGFYALVIAIPFSLLAIRGIKKDDNLIKSVDRIR